MKILRGTLAAVSAAAMLGLAACSAYSDAPASGAPASSGGTTRLAVSVAFYPFEFVAERVGGDQVAVTNLTAPGVEPHDLELTPQQVASLSSVDLVVYQSGFQPAVDTAVAQAKPRASVDTASFLSLLAASQDGAEGDGHTAAADPHTWLDPTNMVTIAEHVRDALSSARPEAAKTFAANTEALVADLTALDTTLKTDLGSCAIKPFITSHAAFGYLANRYGLTQVGINGVEPDVEPSAARIAEVQKIAKDNNVTTIFFETLVSPVVAQSIAGDLGLKTDVLDPLEGITAESRGTDYLEVMRANGASLKTANQCS
ncbi:High-affinity zinc uptake system binding-protein ZnuA [Propionicimonas sp. T2.31MG-18]|uniref:metal ABC transporter substrate-binding protein n=1 Tax=Propionicimonas sp. T2.31MG-18 TaxID=3157620 RepID=UPI0035E91BC2